MAQWKDHGH
ncbi:unnamed protein product, partial [Rotaria sordida]